MPATPPDPAKQAADWNKVRQQFAKSLMVDTKLTSLAQNLEMSDWPIKGPEETPSKYIEMDYDELTKAPGLMGFPDRIQTLITLLRETSAFDDPFGEMTEHVEAAAAKDDAMVKNLARAGVPLDYPLRLMALSADIRKFCDTEKLLTLGDFVTFSQKMAQNIVVGGEFRTLLNALAHTDEKAMAGFLPFRPGAKGLHLPEALGLGPRRLRPADFAGLLKKYGKKALSPEQEKEAARATKDSLHRAEDELRAFYGEITPRFEPALAELRKLVKDGGNLERYFVVLQDADRELIAAKATLLFLKEGAPAPVTKPTTPEAAKPGTPVAAGKPAPEPPKKSGLFGWLFGKK